ncbi:AI-2E family transporter [Candidatus Woesearchaeota archaeon]|nr:AI-2E family transporter [Candidatus Woesearchaeota archaeon]
MVKNKKVHRSVFFYIVLVILIISTIILTIPLLKYLISAAVIAMVIFPMHKYFSKKLKKEWISALLITLLLLLMIIVPTYFIVDEIVKESTVAYITSKQIFLSPVKKICEPRDFTCNFINNLKDIFENPKLKYYAEQGIMRATDAVITKVSNFITALPRVLIGIFIMLVSLFYFLKDGTLISKKLGEVLPMDKRRYNDLSRMFVEISKSVMFGYIVAAISQGIVALIGFGIINLFFTQWELPLITAPVFWAVMLTIFAIIPILGSSIIWFPLSLSMILNGISSDQNNVIYAGIFLMVYGFLAISQIDNLVRPYITSKKMKVHPLLVYVGIFGGLMTVGFVGILVGPLVLALLVSYVKLYGEART